VERIASVTYCLNPAELRRFKQRLGRMQFRPDDSLKMAPIRFTLVLRAHAYHIAGRITGAVEAP